MALPVRTTDSTTVHSGMRARLDLTRRIGKDAYPSIDHSECKWQSGGGESSLFRERRWHSDRSDSMVASQATVLLLAAVRCATIGAWHRHVPSPASDNAYGGHAFGRRQGHNAALRDEAIGAARAKVAARVWSDQVVCASVYESAAVHGVVLTCPDPNLRIAEVRFASWGGAYSTTLPADHPGIARLTQLLRDVRLHNARVSVSMSQSQY